MSKTVRLNSRWSSGDDAVLREMVTTGKSTANIALVLGRTKTSILNRKSNLGLVRKITKTKSKGRPSIWSKSLKRSVVADRKKSKSTYRALGAKWGVPFQTIANWVSADKASRDKASQAKGNLIPKPVTVSKTPVSSLASSPITEKTLPSTFDNTLKVGQEDLIKEAAKIAKQNGMKLTVLQFE